MKEIKAFNSAFIATLLAFLSLAAQAQPATNIFGGGPIKPGPVKEPHAKTTLEDLFQRTESPEVSLPQISLSGVKIPGLPPEATEKLATNFFVVVNDSRISDFAQIYQQNRLDGHANFVTVDSILHPMLAHINAVRASIITKEINPKLLSLLQHMITASVADYQDAQDNEVKDDIQRNLAYLGVGIRLLDPNGKLKEYGGAQELVDAELKNIHQGQTTMSAIFKREENFAPYRPYGWYASTDELKNFYGCRQWLSRMYFLLSDVTNDTSLGSGNEFRRAVLLYKSLIHSHLNSEDGISVWRQLSKTLKILENNQASPSAQDLLPNTFAAVFPPPDANLDLKVEALSQPLARTKMLLSLKSAANKEIGSTSIFELSSIKAKQDRSLSFRFLTPFDPPEFAWVNSQIVRDKDATTGFHALPISLLFLHAHQAKMADNILADNTWRLDEDLISSLPILDKNVTYANDHTSPLCIWSMLANYLKPLPDKTQNSLRTSTWRTCCLESIIGSWVDNWLAFETPDTHGQQTENNDSTSNAPPAMPVKTVRKISNFNYLEPVPEVFKEFLSALNQFDSQLAELGLFPQAYRERSNDFKRLLDRLSVIARMEFANQPLEHADAQLLANIDKVLDKISSPVAGSIYVSYDNISPEVPANAIETIHRNERSSQTFKIGSAASTTSQSVHYPGTNLGLGGPGTLWIILGGPTGPVLARGAVYSFYETPGNAIALTHWLRKLDYGVLKPPFWCEPFQLVDEKSTKH